MKKLNLKLFATVFITALLFISCSNDDDDNNNMEPKTITEIAQANPEFSILVSALVKAELATTLNQSGNYTVFAPTNTAFTTFLNDNGFQDLNAVPTAVLKELLLNHVLNSKVQSTDITTGYVKTLAKGNASTTNTISMYINKGDKVVINGGKDNKGATVTTADIMASNGVIHVVDAVIAIPTIVNHAVANATFSTLVAALSFNTTSGFVTTLSGTTNSPFTVFAPTNTAFTNFLAETKYSGLAAIPSSVLETSLKYHVVTGANVQSTALTNGMKVNTFANQQFTINLTNGATITDASNRVSNIIVTDVQCANGIIHAIDKVLLPVFPK